jgi:hypothetical protein
MRPLWSDSGGLWGAIVTNERKERIEHFDEISEWCRDRGWDEEDLRRMERTILELTGALSAASVPISSKEPSVRVQQFGKQRARTSGS